MTDNDDLTCSGCGRDLYHGSCALHLGEGIWCPDCAGGLLRPTEE